MLTHTIRTHRVFAALILAAGCIASLLILTSSSSTGAKSVDFAAVRSKIAILRTGSPDSAMASAASAALGMTIAPDHTALAVGSTLSGEAHSTVQRLLVAASDTHVCLVDRESPAAGNRGGGGLCRPSEQALSGDQPLLGWVAVGDSPDHLRFLGLFEDGTTNVHLTDATDQTIDLPVINNTVGALIKDSPKSVSWTDSTGTPHSYVFPNNADDGPPPPAAGS